MSIVLYQTFTVLEPLFASNLVQGHALYDSNYCRSSGVNLDKRINSQMRAFCYKISYEAGALVNNFGK